MNSRHPIIVIGGGHAGVEAAHAAARVGCDVILLTLRGDSLVRLSCNPAIGGIGKSHLVREIDAMGGLMGQAADLAGIHFRVLNRSRGPAVQGPRIQQDYERYPAAMKPLLLSTGRVTIMDGEAAAIITERGRVRAVETTEGLRLEAAAVVVTTGTFLRGKLFEGEQVVQGGRRHEQSAESLATSLETLGLHVERFKTGTPPRIVASSVDSSKLVQQPGDEDPVPLSFENLSDPEFRPALPQTMTHLAYTNVKTHQIVRDGLDRSPLYSGRIQAKGPRYCPSFEDKVIKFPERDTHLLHVEPMGLDHPWVYLNGLSTSLPAELQVDLVHSIPGFERAELARFGYSVEYDYLPPGQMHASLETRAVAGVFPAGQLCGTTGYEEAAALGLVAGANAARFACGEEPWIPNRLNSYIGVMVDDLTTKGILEPYRMFTSRAELRLSLAPDTADRRMGPVAVHLGLLSARERERSVSRWKRIDAAREALDCAGDLQSARPEQPADRIRRGEGADSVLAEHYPAALAWPTRDRETLIAQLRYRGYLDIERRGAEKLRKADQVRIPEDFDFSAAPGLSTEVRARFEETRPSSLGQASRIPGVTPAAVALLSALIAAGRGAR